jgi:hypothetical protein
MRVSVSGNTDIWKYPIALAQGQRIMMPRGAVLLDFQTQGMFQSLVMWALVKPDAPVVHRVLSVFGTGNGIPDGEYTYVGTTQVDRLVWHLFDHGEE